MPKANAAAQVVQVQPYGGYHFGWGGQVARIVPVGNPENDLTIDDIALNRFLRGLEPESATGACLELDVPYWDERNGGSGVTAVTVSVGDIKTACDAAYDRCGVSPVFGFLNSRGLKGYGDVFIRTGFDTIRGVACQFRPRAREDYAGFHTRVEKAINVVSRLRPKPLIVRETFLPRVTLVWPLPELVWPLPELFYVAESDGTLDAAYSAHIVVSKLLDGDLVPDVLGCTIALPGIGYTLEGKHELFAKVEYPEDGNQIESSTAGLRSLIDDLRQLMAASH